MKLILKIQKTGHHSFYYQIKMNGPKSFFPVCDWSVALKTKPALFHNAMQLLTMYVHICNKKGNPDSEIVSAEKHQGNPGVKRIAEALALPSL